MRPGENTPAGVKTRRVYQILRRRYIEQLSQGRVAADLSLSVRQTQRDESLARAVLAHHLWTLFGLDKEKDLQGLAADTSAEPLTRARELELLSETVPRTVADIHGYIVGAIETVSPLARSAGVELTCNAQGRLLAGPVREVMLRQALVDVLGAAIRCVPSGEVRIRTDRSSGVGGSPGVTIFIEARSADGRPPRIPSDCVESLQVANQLVALCPGSLRLSEPDTNGSTFDVALALPALDGAHVLVIDDNRDTLQLFERYLSHTRYAFLGAQDAQSGRALCRASRPDIIVLDVMMPGQDGWTLLTSLREDPATASIPIIVCTILAEKDLALTLGAAAFLRKPVSRQNLVRVLDRYCEPHTDLERRTALK